MTHSHVQKVLDWKLSSEMNWIADGYGCTGCDETFADVIIDEEVFGHMHTEYVVGCFGCKAKTLQLAVGDAHSQAATSGKKWDAEVNAFADAQRQGIKPGGVFQKDIDAAHQASEILGRPYDGDTMMPAHKITAGVAEIMKEIN